MSHYNTGTVLNVPYWGEVTASLDFCETNYQFSSYVAEVANTFSNLIFVALALYGVVLVLHQRLPGRYAVGYMGFALVGIGSFVYHATLLYEAQQADELPMIYVATYCFASLFDTSKGFDIHSPKSRAVPLAIATLAFDILFTWSYSMYRNPVYHQVVFGAVLLCIAARAIVLVRDPAIAQRMPAAIKAQTWHIFASGSAMFQLGFIVWNLDTIFCETITGWKHAIGWPAAFLLEGHAWWHILTAAGTYLMLVAHTYFTLCIKDDYRDYAIQFVLGLPTVQRTGKAKSQ